ncbi:MAG: glycosyltransferase [Dehalococcoidia bacterium]|nr:glycosyltransferase [Dehalococcoidia bacterium]
MGTVVARFTPALVGGGWDKVQSHNTVVSMEMKNNQRRLRILFLPAWYPSEDNPVYGIFVREYAKAAALYNDIVVLYVYWDQHPQPRGLYRISDEVEEGIRTIRVKCGGVFSYFWHKFVSKSSAREQKTESLPNSKIKTGIARKLFMTPLVVGANFLYYWSILAAFRKLVREGWRPDIIHAHVFTAGVSAVTLGKLYRIPIVITEHYTGFPRHILGLSGRIRARFAMNRARIILPVSNALENAIKDYGIKNKFQVIPNVVNTDMFHLPFFQNMKNYNEIKQLLLVANISPQKGIPYLLEALKQIKNERQDFRLDIVGEGQNRKEYEGLTKTLGLENMVKFHGRKSKEEVAEFMRRCDFFVQPSLYETFGVVYIEAMACGKPVIATNLPVLRDLINEDRGILVPSKDVYALAQAVDYMLDHYNDYSKEKISNYVKEKFSCKVVGGEIDKVYKQILIDSL